MLEKNKQLLLKQIRYIENNSPFYKRMFFEKGLSTEDFSLDSFQKIPITCKEDLEEHNEAFICVPKTEIIDYVTTSGTMGNPVTMALNDPDLDRLALNEQLSFACAGVTKEDIVQITTTLDRRFMAGLAYFLGLRKLGAGLVRVGAGAPGLQWDSIARFQPTYLVAVPSFLLKLIAYANENGIDVQQSSVKAAICIGEPLRNNDFSLNTLGKKLKEAWDIELYSTYASTEMCTAFTECEAHRGGHVLENLIYTEIIGEDGSPVKPGEVGELVVTTLGVETMPLLRYATGDMVQMHTDHCTCGRKSPRLSPVLGRKKQQIKLKGTTIYPQHIKDILVSFDAIKHYIIEVYTDVNGVDAVEVKISSETPVETQKRLKEELRARLRVLPKVNTLAKLALQRIKFPEGSRKPIVFIDRRK